MAVSRKNPYDRFMPEAPATQEHQETPIKPPSSPQNTLGELRRLHESNRYTAKTLITSAIPQRNPQDVPNRSLTRTIARELTIKDIEKQEAVKQTSEIDPLTGLPNEKGFHHKVADEMRRLAREQARTNKQMVIIIGSADLNGLKAINDSLGHGAGTEYIQKAARILGSGNRPTDIVAHPHGDEFLFALPATDLPGAIDWLDRKTEELRQNGISVSLGISLLNPAAGEEALKKAMEESDEAMYRAKEESRHQGCEYRVYGNTPSRKNALTRAREALTELAISLNPFQKKK